MNNKFHNINIGSSLSGNNQVGNGILRRRRSRRLRKSIRRKNLLRLYLNSVDSGKNLLKKLIGGNKPNKSLYKYIINPNTDIIHSISSIAGKNLLMKYIS